MQQNVNRKWPTCAPLGWRYDYMNHEVRLGQLIEGHEIRDAIHIAVAPVVAGVRLYPGDHVGILSDGRASEAADHIGIVDPFLKGRLNEGDSFWLMLYPQTVKSLRHEWTHPAFKPEEVPVKAQSEKWLRDFAEENIMDFDELVAGAVAGSSVHAGTQIYEFNDPRHAALFWHHLEIWTGKAFSYDHRERLSWTCAC
jgi:hypothetical protein